MFSKCRGLSIKEKDHLAGYRINDDGGACCLWLLELWRWWWWGWHWLWWWWWWWSLIFILLFKASAQWLPQYSIKQLCKCFSKLDSGRVWKWEHSFLLNLERQLLQKSDWHDYIFARVPENGAQSGELDRWEGRAVPDIPEVQSHLRMLVDEGTY